MIACAECGIEFEGRRKNRRFCSKRCSRTQRDRSNRKKINARMRAYNADHRDTIRSQAASRRAKSRDEKPALPIFQCKNCGKDFGRRDPRQRCCSKKCGAARYDASEPRKEANLLNARKSAPQRNARNRERYKTDPDFRWAFRSWQIKNPDRVRAINDRHRQKPESREKAKLKSKNWHSKNRDYANPRRAQRLAQTLKITPWYTALNGARLRALKNNRPFDLTDEWARERWTGRCELTGVEFRRGTSTHKFWSASIDKIVPSLGYVQGNSRFVLNSVNTFKNNETDADMYFVAEALLAAKSGDCILGMLSLAG